MKKLSQILGFNNKKKPKVSLDQYKENIQKEGDDSLIENDELILGGVLEGRSPDFVDLTPRLTHRGINSELDMLP
ncbi:MAG: hypothetical protein JST68_18685 [Bacteroidetes bacterium]|nr:hypothetical protein [Bacteroidota bacterium]